jgi:hypothetical protein
MASPPIPPSLDHLTTRPFSFYPPILNIEHNEWLFRKATWSEILVVNCKSGADVWISRRLVGEVSRIEDPVLIVGLKQELEYKGGTVWPYQRRVIEMPVAVGGLPMASGEVPNRGASAPVVGIRLESNDRRIFKLIAAALPVAVLLCLAALRMTQVGEVRQGIVFTTKDQQYLALTSRDDYFAAVQKLGKPATDRWQSESGELQYRALGYPDRKYTVILMGSGRQAAVYIGTMDENWKAVHSVELHSGGTTASLLRSLKRF